MYKKLKDLTKERNMKSKSFFVTSINLSFKKYINLMLLSDCKIGNVEMYKF